jgi:hypothetical protein
MQQARLVLPEPMQQVQLVLPEVPAAEAVHTVAAAAVRIGAAAAAHTEARVHRKRDRTQNRTARHCRIFGTAYRPVSQRPMQPA